ncbi:MAG TPA: SAM-dependent methyltransferase [Polyangiaceae bacterium]|jgi:methyltransferase (TIGR00027 family)|nr:SAM-dependent methyltransferase [Polyangiaceae bacterium]
MSAGLFTDVADTATWVAAYRAMESERPDALFRDPLAARVAGARGRRLAAEVVGAETFAWNLAIRTCVIDELVTAAIREGVDTVVNLGAGMDTRPYRLALPPSLTWIEADQPAILERKEACLRDERPRCVLRRAKVDLANAAERSAFLAAVGASPGRALVLTEGVVDYLSNDDVGALAADLAGLACAWGWIVDYSSPMLRRAVRRRRSFKSDFRRAPFLFDPSDWEAFFRRRGWRIAKMRYLVDEGEQRGRSVPLPAWLRLAMKVLPSQREEIRKMQAYVLLDRPPR